MFYDLKLLFWVVQNDPGFYFVNHLQNNPKSTLKLCSFLLNTLKASVSPTIFNNFSNSDTKVKVFAHSLALLYKYLNANLEKAAS